MDDEIYSEIILELYRNPKNFGHLPQHDILTGGGNPVCGDEVVFEIKVDKDKIRDIRFSGHGCAISRASQSLLTEMVRGKTLEDAKGITNERIFESLGGVIQTRIKCALLGLAVLKMGIEAFEKNGKTKTTVANLKI